MATVIVGSSADAKTKRTPGTYYTPPSCIDDVPEVVKSGETCNQRDFYSGSAEALAAAGLLPLGMFPGQPGRPIGKASYRPLGAARRSDEPWWRTPGYLTVTRRANGTFCIGITLSHEAQAHREAAAAEREAKRRTEVQLRQATRGVADETARLKSLTPPCRLPAGWAVIVGGKAQVARHG
ncbi:MAG: hypothetical protein KGN16_01055 [Burkholderiales bacterium]|nr:hypothetical protein [Burkholderiales bacterium]